LSIFNSAGSIKMYDTTIYVGTKYKYQEVTVTFDPITARWLVRQLNGTFLKSSDRAVPTEKTIKNFAL